MEWDFSLLYLTFFLPSICACLKPSPHRYVFRFLCILSPHSHWYGQVAFSLLSTFRSVFKKSCFFVVDLAQDTSATLQELRATRYWSCSVWVQNPSECSTSTGRDFLRNENNYFVAHPLLRILVSRQVSDSLDFRGSLLCSYHVTMPLLRL